MQYSRAAQVDLVRRKSRIRRRKPDAKSLLFVRSRRKRVGGGVGGAMEVNVLPLVVTFVPHSCLLALGAVSDALPVTNDNTL